VAVGVLLFVGGMALAIRRATGHLLVARSALMLVTAFAILAAELPPLYTLAIAFAGVTAACVLEQRMRLPLEVGSPSG
jgi:hypothetical protein